MPRNAVCLIFCLLVILTANGPAQIKVYPTGQSDALSSTGIGMHAPDSSSRGLNLVYSRSYLDLSKLPTEPLPSTSIVVTAPYTSSGKMSIGVSSSNYNDIGMRMMEQRRQFQGEPVPVLQIIQYVLDKLNPKPAPGPPTLHFIPSQEELNVLNSVWTQKEISDRQVYANLDTSVRLTAVDVNQVLKKLESKGVLTSELISPRNEFTFLTPFGGLPVEMSATNLRNRVYRYKSLVDRRHMMRYLQARLGQATARNAGGQRTPDDSLRQVHELQDKIIQLIQPE